jgi:divalent metal cation (Fe/Co/Zn/Cd) transporter
MIFSALINEIMVRLKIYFREKENSVALISDVHSRVDVFTYLAVFAGLILNKYWIFIDSVFIFNLSLHC